MDISPISLAVGRYWRLRYDGNMGHEPSRPLVDRILRFWWLTLREVCKQRTDNSWNITDDEPTGQMVTINSLARKTLQCRRFEAKLPDRDANQSLWPSDRLWASAHHGLLNERDTGVCGSGSFRHDSLHNRLRDLIRSCFVNPWVVYIFEGCVDRFW